MARAPLAPGLLTTGTAVSSSLAAPSATARAIRSVEPPGAAPTVTLIGLLGNESLLPVAPPTLPPQAVIARTAEAAAAPNRARRVGKCFMERGLLGRLGSSAGVNGITGGSVIEPRKQL